MKIPNFGIFLRRFAHARATARLSLDQAALAIGVSRERLKGIEDGRDKIVEHEFDAACQAYVVPGPWLLALPPFDV